MTFCIDITYSSFMVCMAAVYCMIFCCLALMESTRSLCWFSISVCEAVFAVTCPIAHGSMAIFTYAFADDTTSKAQTQTMYFNFPISS